MIKRISGPLFILLLVLLSGCGDLPENTDAGKTLSGLTLSPAKATVKIGTSQSFSATAKYTDGTSLAVAPTWSVSGNIGTIASVGYSGVFTASEEGTGSVTATYKTVSASAPVTVEGSASASGLVTIEVYPALLRARVLAVQTFTATGTNASGESIAITPTWTMTGDAVGNFTARGTVATLEALAEGAVVISCSSYEISGSAAVTIEGRTLVITVESDTYVDEANQGTSYEADTAIKAGCLGTMPVTHYEAYLRFSLAALPAGASIETATLNLYAITAGTPSLQMYKLTSAFSAATTWSSRPTSGTFILSKVFTGGANNTISADELLSAVRAWLAAPAGNYGLAFRQDGADNGIAVLTSKENIERAPTLVIEYKQ